MRCQLSRFYETVLRTNKNDDDDDDDLSLQRRKVV